MEAPEVKERAFAIPLTSPSYPRGPYRFTDRVMWLSSGKWFGLAAPCCTLSKPSTC